MTRANLAQAFPEKPWPEREQIARGAYENFALAAVEAVCFDLLSDEELARTVAADALGDWAKLEPLMRARQPVLVASAHFGSWELLGEVMARRNLPVSAVVRPLAGAFNARLVASRRRSGLETILQRGAMRGIFSALKQGRTVVQMIDQSIPADDGVFVPFFGRPACTTVALSQAALRSGAPVFVVLAAREAGTLKLFVEGPIPRAKTGNREADLVAHVSALTAIVERTIRKHPEQWLWLHRRWKVQPARIAP